MKIGCSRVFLKESTFPEFRFQWMWGQLYAVTGMWLCGCGWEGASRNRAAWAQPGSGRGGWGWGVPAARGRRGTWFPRRAARPCSWFWELVGKAAFRAPTADLLNQTCWARMGSSLCLHKPRGTGGPGPKSPELGGSLSPRSGEPSSSVGSKDRGDRTSQRFSQPLRWPSVEILLFSHLCTDNR